MQGILLMLIDNFESKVFCFLPSYFKGRYIRTLFSPHITSTDSYQLWLY